MPHEPVEIRSPDSRQRIKGNQRLQFTRYSGDCMESSIIIPSTWAFRKPYYVAPSWSWPSVDFDKRDFLWYHSLRPVYHRELRNDGVSQPVSKVIVSVNNVGSDPFGQVVAGSSLTIETPYREVCRYNIPPSFFDCYGGGLGPEVTFVSLVHTSDVTSEQMASLKASELYSVDIVQQLPCSTRQWIVHPTCVSARHSQTWPI
jgi:hypothetical protein